MQNTCTNNLPLPMVRELEDPVAPLQMARQLSQLPGLLLLESTLQHEQLGRYSFLMADPVETHQPVFKKAASTFDWLDKTIANFPVRLHQGLPPFQGGVAGMLDYEFNLAIEPILANAEKQTPTFDPVTLGIYDVVFAWDHVTGKRWIFSSGYPEKDPGKRATLASHRLQFFLQDHPVAPATKRNDLKHDPTETNGKPPNAPQNRFPCEAFPGWASNFTRHEYLSVINRALEYIHAGDIFQVNVAQQLFHPAVADSFDLYDKLRRCNPSTFAAWFDTGKRKIISASPERLVSVRNGTVETRPIKGTRRRTSHPEIDIDLARQLLNSEKDRAENIMIVDLMRNDLSRICTDDSVHVSQFVELEKYASVLHLVSAVQGSLRQETTPSQILKAVFPGGSISGAPKIRSMEIISELEPDRRGAYCGSVGYFGFDGNIDLNILIRTVTEKNGTWTIPAGGGIVADSDPLSEYEETWTKANRLVRAVEMCQNDLVDLKKKPGRSLDSTDR